MASWRKNMVYGGDKVEAMAAELGNFAQKIVLSKRYSPQEMYAVLEEKYRIFGYRLPAGKLNKILIISLNAIGDNVLYSAFVRELRRCYPQSYIVMVVTPLVYPLMEHCPYVNKLLSLSYVPFETFTDYFPRFVEFCSRELLPQRFTASFCVQWSDDKRPMNLLAYLSGAQRRIGISDKSLLAYNENFRLIDQWEFLLTDALTTPVELVHEAERALYVLEAFGYEIKNKSTELWLDNTDKYNAARLRGIEGAYIVLGLGAGAPNRKYPLPKWLMAMTAIYQKYRIPFVICGGGSEAADGTYLTEKMPSGSVVNIVGRTNLRETAALIDDAYCYLGNVTGAMHMAAALKTPLITLYREAKERADAPAGVFSESTRFAPWQAKALVLQPDRAKDECLHTVTYGGCKEEYAHCIAQITPQEIVAAFDYIAEYFY